MKRFFQIVCLILVISMVLALPTFAAEQASKFLSVYRWTVAGWNCQGMDGYMGKMVLTRNLASDFLFASIFVCIARLNLF